MRPKQIRYPIEPLLALSGLTLSGLNSRRRMAGVTYSKARREGLTPYQADKYACLVGLHPSMVWASWLEDEFARYAVPCRECGSLFVPSRKGNIYCVPRCGRRARSRATRARWRAIPANRARMNAYQAEYRSSERARETARKYRRAYYAKNRARELERQRRYDAEVRGPRRRAERAA